MRGRTVKVAVVLAAAVGIGATAFVVVHAPRVPPGCGQLEILVDQASACEAFPEAWPEWSRIARAYGLPVDDPTYRSAESCPQLIQRARAVGLSRDELVAVALWTARYDRGLRAYWRDVLKVDFCADIKRLCEARGAPDCLTLLGR